MKGYIAGVSFEIRKNHLTKSLSSKRSREFFVFILVPVIWCGFKVFPTMKLVEHRKELPQNIENRKMVRVQLLCGMLFMALGIL